MLKNKNYWNYRILTRMVNVEDKNMPYKEWREFFISEVYYKGGKPVSHSATWNPLAGWDSLDDLKWTAKHVREALKKPILDVNNWPKKWNPKKSKENK